MLFSFEFCSVGSKVRNPEMCMSLVIRMGLEN